MYIVYGSIAINYLNILSIRVQMGIPRNFADNWSLLLCIMKQHHVIYFKSHPLTIRVAERLFQVK